MPLLPLDPPGLDRPVWEDDDPNPTDDECFGHLLRRSIRYPRMNSVLGMVVALVLLGVLGEGVESVLLRQVGDGPGPVWITLHLTRPRLNRIHNSEEEEEPPVETMLNQRNNKNEQQQYGMHFHRICGRKIRGVDACTILRHDDETVAMLRPCLDRHLHGT